MSHKATIKMDAKLKQQLDALYVVYDAERDAILRHVPTNDIILFGDDKHFEYQGGMVKVNELTESLQQEIYNQEEQWN